MNRTLIALAFSGAVMVPAQALAATVTNSDDTPHAVIVSEGENRQELNIGPGETIEICPAGCFLTMPNGDREVLTGTETLQIEAGRGVFQ